MLATGKYRTIKRNGLISRQMALIMPVLILIMAICIDMGRFVYTLKNVRFAERPYRITETILFEPYVSVGLIAAFTWIVFVARPPRT